MLLPPLLYHSAIQALHPLLRKPDQTRLMYRDEISEEQRRSTNGKERERRKCDVTAIHNVGQRRYCGLE